MTDNTQESVREACAKVAERVGQCANITGRDESAEALGEDIADAISAMPLPTTQPTDNTGLIEPVALAIEIAVVEKTMHHPIKSHWEQLKWLWPHAAKAAIDVQAAALATKDAALAEAERDETCPICEGAPMGQGEFCIAVCREGKVRWTTANVLRSIMPWIATKDAEIAALKEAVSRFVNDFDDGDRADVGTSALLLAHISDFEAALGAKP